MSTPSKPAQQITLFDGVCLIMGVMVGAGVYESTPVVAQYTTSAAALLGVWTLGGVLSLLGALSYSGLARRFPETGGDYVFLKKGYGIRFSFLYAWCMLTVVRPGALGAMSYVFGRYAQQVFPLGEDGVGLYAGGSIVFLSVLNLLGTREGKRIQDFLTVTKILGIAFLILVALGTSSDGIPAVIPPRVHEPSFILALIFVLFAYGGWNEIAFVAAEVKNPQRNLSRTLVWGTLGVTAIYLIINGAFLHAIGFEALGVPGAVVRTILSHSVPGVGSVLVNSLIAVSALGAVHGMIFSGARIYYAMGQDHRLFSRLGKWGRRNTPGNSILAESAITLALMTLFARGGTGFERMVLYTTPLFWFFTATVSLSTFWLLERRKAQQTIWGYPLTPALFFLTCLFMLGMSLQYAFENVSMEIFWSLGLVGVGIGVEPVENWLKSRRRAR